MSRNRIIKRLFKTFSLFLISALIHELTARQLDPTYSDYADLKFYGINAVAVTLEYAFLHCMRSSRKSEDGSECRVRRRGVLRLALVRLLGYVWVVGFLVWVFPKCYYKRVYDAIHE